MKNFICIAALLIAALAVPVIGANDQNANNKISIGFYFPANNQGSFSMVGAGDAQGLAEVTSAMPYPDPTGNGLRIMTTKALHYAGGDVFLATDGALLVSALTKESTGTWIVSGGNGIYANASGGGKYHWCRTLSSGILVGAYSGNLKLDATDDANGDARGDVR